MKIFSIFLAIFLGLGLFIIPKAHAQPSKPARNNSKKPQPIRILIPDLKINQMEVVKRLRNLS